MKNQSSQWIPRSGPARTLRLLLLIVVCWTVLPPATITAKPAVTHLQEYLATLAQHEPDERVRVIVQLAAPLPTAAMVVEELGGRYVRDLPLINAFVTELPAHALPVLAQLPMVKQVSLDTPVYKMNEGAAGLLHLRDDFNQPFYTNSDGNLPWAAGWQEIGESDGPTVGDVAITPFWGGALQGLRLQGADRGVMRPIDLTQAVNATVAVAYRRKDLTDEHAFVTLRASIDGGASWQEITRWQGPATDAEIQYGYYDLAALVGRTLLLQVRTAPTMNAEGKLYLDYVDLQLTPQPDAQLQLSETIYLPLIAGTAQTVQAAQASAATLSSTYVKAIGADRLWSDPVLSLTGKCVTVAVVDSGITEHPDLRTAAGQSRVLARVSFVQDGKSPDDYYGHGTHVAGIIGGNGAQSGGKYMGVAPEVNLLDVKVTDDHGVGRMSDVVAGLEWVLKNKSKYNIRIANLSLNSTVPDSYHVSPLNAAVEILWFNGITVVVSAGNDGSYKLNAPANDPFVITVGAVDDKGTAAISDDELAKFSAYNITEDGFAKPDLVAPGRNLVALLSADDNNLASDYPANKLTGSEGSAYYKMSGTSMASAVVAGAVALLVQKEPTLTPDQVKYRLMNSVQPFVTPQGCASGAGYLDIYAATKTSTTQSANTGVRASRLLWSGSQPVTWNSVSWNSVSWNSVSWNSVSWNSVSWNSVSWNSVSWNSNSATESAPQYSCRDVDPTGLVGHWRLDETNGTLIADASANDNIGTLNSGAARQSDGKRNSAVQVSNSAVNIPSSASLNSVTNGLTLSAWIRRTSAKSGWQIVMSRQYGTAWDDQFYLAVYDNSYAFGINTVNQGNQGVMGGTNPLNEWVHLAAVYNGSQMTLYVNGIATASRTINGNLRTDNRPLLIGANANGADPNSADEFFAGQIDDVRLYKRALSAVEISAMVNGPGNPAPSLAIYNDQLDSNWVDSSWNSTRTFDGTASVYSGNKAIHANISAAWGSFALWANTPVSTNGYSGLRFQIHGGASGVRRLQIKINNNGSYPVFVDAYANQWTQVEIPFTAIGNPTSVQQIFWQDAIGTAQPTFAVDQIEFVTIGR